MDEKEELIEAIQAVFGVIPPNAREVLKVIGHPDVIEATKRYIHAIDTASRCQNYEPPWSCGKEAEARYENIKYGWLGGTAGVGLGDWWCEPCRKRVMDG